MRPQKTIEWNQIQRILLIRLSSMGDVVLTTPLIRLLRNTCPQAQIDFLVKSEYQDTLKEHPEIHNLLTWNTHKQSLIQLGQTLRANPYDMVLNLHHHWQSFFFLKMAKARYKLKYTPPTFKTFLRTRLGWRVFQKITPIPELYAAPLRDLGLTSPLPPLEMHLDPKTSKSALALVKETLSEKFPQFHSKLPPLLAISPGARWATKRWSVKGFAHVAEEVAEKKKAALVIFGTQDETPLIEELCNHLPPHIPVFKGSGQLSLMEVAAILQQCELLLSNDSGLMHMAAALKTPIVSIFGPTSPEFGFTPFRAPHQIVSLPLPCRPCSSKGSPRCPKKHHHCMKKISSSQVLPLALNMWGRDTL